MNDLETARAAAAVPRGVALATIGILAAPLIDIFSKLAGETIPPVEITAMRFAVQAALMLPLLIFSAGIKTPKSERNWLKTQAFHAARGGLITLGMIAFVTTLQSMEVADAIAIFFVEPIILTVLGAVFLKETVGWRRYTACAVGFLGAMIVIRPSFQEVGPVALLPVVTALTVAIFALLTRMAAQRENPFAMQFYAGLWGFAFCVLIMAAGLFLGIELISPVLPDVTHTGFMVGVGAAAAFSGIMSVFSFRHAPASTLAPLQYFEIVSATILGWMVFGDLPDAMKWLGISIIIASGLYIIWRERRVKAQIVTAMRDTPPP